MHIIVGLGNPGKKYEYTRHNAGFLFLDALASHFQVSFSKDKKFNAEIAEVITHEGQKLLLVKPDNFMNNSGAVVANIVHYYKVDLSHVLVIHDDIDITAGTFKVTSSSRSAGHNGAQSIIDTLGTQNFQRIRLGVGRPNEILGACMPSHEYVVSPFHKEELVTLQSLFPEVQEHVIRWLHHEHAS